MTVFGVYLTCTFMTICLAPFIVARGSERCALLQLAMLLAVQLGEDHPELLTAVKPLLMQMSLDSSVAAQERAMVSLICLV